MAAGQPLRGLLGFPGQDLQRFRGLVAQTMAQRNDRLAGIYLAVAGGGNGAGTIGGTFGQGGGGGGGGVQRGVLSLTRDEHWVTVGPAAADTFIDDLIRAFAGGAGGGVDGPGLDGASGGGAGNDLADPGGLGRPGQGNDGGPSTATGGQDGFGDSGGGGGAAAAGVNRGSVAAGLASNIPGDSGIYGRGGSCGISGDQGTPGEDGTGQGGAGGYGMGIPAGGLGGSGKFAWAYPGARKATGGTITSFGGWTIHTFLNGTQALIVPRQR